MKKSIKIFRMLPDILYPRRCPVCHGILKDQRTFLCPECEGGFHPVLENYCLKCGKPVKPEEEYCKTCLGTKRSFDRGRGIFLYDNKMRKSLILYKYYGRREYAEYYGRAMCRYGGMEIRRWKPDVIVPVPLHRRKLRMRGFNQSGYLARQIEEELHIPVAEEILKKVRDTKSQKKLDAAGRKRNLRSAFRAEEKLTGLTVLVVDDVFTTGSTVDAAASCLKAAGAEKVFFITLCVGQT